MKNPKLKTSIALAAALLGLAAPAYGQTVRCVRVSDPDGWVNVRSASTGEAIGTFDSGTEFYTHRQGGRKYAIVLEAPNLMVHRSRLRNVQHASACQSHHTVIDPDGYVNVRAEPGGTIISRLSAGERVLRISQSSGNWMRVLTPYGNFGYIHKSRLSGSHF